MKRIGNLYDKVCDFENLLLADQRARKGKNHTYGVRKFDQDPIGNLTALRKALLDQTFKNSEYTISTIWEPKERQIHRLPYFPDRIVHHAIMNILERIWVSTFTRDTYSCIKNRGIHAAANAVKSALRKDPEGTRYCLKLDVCKFYPSIKHEVLKGIIRKKIKDKKLLWLLDEIIDSAPGVPIGNYLSQYFANLYMAYFDHWIKEVKGVKHYFRYADDMVVLAKTKAELHALLRDIQEYFVGLQIEVKGNWQVFPIDARGLDFVGYVFYRTHTLMRKSIKQNFFRKVARLNKRKKISEVEYKKALSPWWGWAKYCDSKNLIRKIKTSAKYEIEFKYPSGRAA
ncbi:reverse transcriptase domain-containing protein [Leadbetterella byssophila]|uniref:RNA-directed DNA polymerase n=1 Tax=Leadbetterella byssophila TaxID=316068 RepID=UPI0039A28A66